MPDNQVKQGEQDNMGNIVDVDGQPIEGEENEATGRQQENTSGNRGDAIAEEKDIWVITLN